MHDSLTVRSVQGVGHLNRNPQGIVERQRTSFEAVGKRSPLEILHDEIVDVTLLPHIEYRADMRMTQTGHRLCFPLESGLQFGLIGETPRKNLDRDGAVQAFVPGAIHLAHSTGANRRDDFIRAQVGSAS